MPGRILQRQQKVISTCCLSVHPWTSDTETNLARLSACQSSTTCTHKRSQASFQPFPGRSCQLAPRHNWGQIGESQFPRSLPGLPRHINISGWNIAGSDLAQSVFGGHVTAPSGYTRPTWNLLLLRVSSVTRVLVRPPVPGVVEVSVNMQPAWSRPAPC